MITNTYLKVKREGIIAKKTELGRKKNENNKFINASGITKNARNFINPKNIDQEKLSLVNKAIENNMAIDAELRKLKEELYEINSDLQTEKNLALINLFKEIFEKDQLQELYNECNRRMKGETPFKISFQWKDFYQHKENSTKYKKLLIEQLDKMISFRILLTGIIDKGCEQFGNAEFLKFISPLNKHIIPVEDLEKIKRKIIG